MERGKRGGDGDGNNINVLLESRIHVGFTLLTEVVERDLFDRCIAHAVAMLPCVAYLTHGHEFTSFILSFGLLSKRSSHDNRIGHTSLLANTPRYTSFLILRRVYSRLCTPFDNRSIVSGGNVYLEMGLIFLFCPPFRAPVGWRVWRSFCVIFWDIIYIVDLGSFVSAWMARQGASVFVVGLFGLGGWEVRSRRPGWGLAGGCGGCRTSS